MAKSKTRAAGRMRRKLRIRKKMSGSAERPRLTVFRSARHIYAQIVDDDRGVTLAAASSLAIEDAAAAAGNVAQAKVVGTLLAERAKAAGIESVSFDRNGFLYHGRVKALADAAREGGLQF